MKEETERVDHAIHTTIDRVDDTADRVRSNVRAKTSRLVGFVRGARVAIETMLQSRERQDATCGMQATSGRPAIDGNRRRSSWQTDTIVSTTKVAAAAAS